MFRRTASCCSLVKRDRFLAFLPTFAGIAVASWSRAYFLESRLAKTIAAPSHNATTATPMTTDGGSGTVCGFNGGSIGQEVQHGGSIGRGT
jgi:hypothetical protein